MKRFGKIGIFDYVVSFDEDQGEWTAKCCQNPDVQGFGDSRREAVEMLADELILWTDGLMYDDQSVYKQFDPEMTDLIESFQIRSYLDDEEGDDED